MLLRSTLVKRFLGFLVAAVGGAKTPRKLEVALAPENGGCISPADPDSGLCLRVNTLIHRSTVERMFGGLSSFVDRRYRVHPT